MAETPFVGPGEKPPAYRTALLLVDIQNDYFPGGKNELEGSVEAGRNAARILEFFRSSDRPILHIQHISRGPGAAFFLPDTDGVRIHGSVSPRPGEIVIEKNYPNAFRGKRLLPKLGMLYVARLVICGMMTHLCIDATVRAACDYKFECVVAEDACAAKALVRRERTVAAADVHAAFLAALDGTYAQVMNTDDVIALLSSPQE